MSDRRNGRQLPTYAWGTPSPRSAHATSTANYPRTRGVHTKSLMCNPRPTPQGLLGSWFTVTPSFTSTPQAIRLCFSLPYRGQIQRRIIVSVDLKSAVLALEYPVVKCQVVLDATTP